MKILTGIPVLTNYGWLEQCLSAVKGDVLFIDNNSDQECKRVMNERSNMIIANEENNYVNPAWNQIMEFFLNHSEYTHLHILSSDLLMSEGWEEFYAENWQETLIPTPRHIDNDLVKFKDIPKTKDYYEVDCVQGTTIFLSRKQVKLVYPIPDGILVWFGDEYIFKTLRSYGYKTVLYRGLAAHHGNSRSVSVLKNMRKIIEEDKVAWAKIGL